VTFHGSTCNTDNYETCKSVCIWSYCQRWPIRPIIFLGTILNFFIYSWLFQEMWFIVERGESKTLPEFIQKRKICHFCLSNHAASHAVCLTLKGNSISESMWYYDPTRWRHGRNLCWGKVRYDISLIDVRTNVLSLHALKMYLLSCLGEKKDGRRLCTLVWKGR